MKFRVIKASIDGICGGDSTLFLKQVLAGVRYHAGWSNLNEMHAAIRRWAKQAKPGSCFKTRGSAIVATGCIDSPPEVDKYPKCGEENLDYGDLDPVEEGNIEQTVTCPKCGERWQDIFVLAERHELTNANA